MKLKRTCMWMAAILVVALASPAGAATRTWDNDAGDNDWFTIANWDSISAFSPDELTNNYHIRAGISELEVIGKVVHIGTWDAQSDSDVTFYDDISSPGDLTGTGAVMFLADYAPKLSAAAVSFGGDVVLGSATTLQIELGGLLGGYEYDIIDVAGNFSLTGALNLVLIDGLKPQLGNMFDIFNFKLGGLFGISHTINLPVFSGVLVRDTSPLYITNEGNSTPEPATIALLGFSSLALLTRRRA